MGLDSVDLLLEVERAFGVTLDERACANVVTVGDLCELVLASVPPAKHERCLTALAFWRLRRALVAAFGSKRSAVRPDSNLRMLVWPPERRAPLHAREAWSRLERMLGLALPPLERSRRLFWACIAVVVLLGAGLSVSLGPSERWLAAGVTVGAACLLGVATRPWKIHAPADVETVGDLARALVLREAGRLAVPAGGFTRAQIETIVPRIVANETGNPIERVTLDTRIVADLGID
ncbi:MAG TPA: acyl carrier protein [Planctomycetota bacterium]|nr:acyl carrier protein [Planctomycetota bacterium]